MNTAENDLGQPIGFPVEDWQPAALPTSQPLIGRHCWLEQTSSAIHANGLYRAFAEDKTGFNWTYLPYGPFNNQSEFNTWLDQNASESDPMFHTILDTATETIAGLASYLRINPVDGVIEVGHIHFSPLIQRTCIATEAMYLMMRQAFALGYRRYEWKCDALNRPSCNAAKRFGFSYEGTFRQLTMYKQRNRDTAWFAIVDSDWPAIQRGFEAWLDRNNFDHHGRQKQSLSAFMPK